MFLSHVRLNPRCVAIVALCLWAGWVQGSDVKKDVRPFQTNMDEDGIKTFTISGKKPFSEAQLLPAVPQALPRSLSTSELAHVPEVGLEDPLPRTGTKQEALETLEFRFAKVNHFNLKKTDGFLQALLAQRPDLAGLPFKMGTDCRLPQERALALGAAIRLVRTARDAMPELDEANYQGVVAALMQIHGPKEKQADLAKKLSTIPHIDATMALARLALFSPDGEARETAARGVKVRRDQDDTGILLDGLRHPWPTAGRRAVEALVRLERKDLVPALVHALAAPDPRLPVRQKSGWDVRELVRINHHRNCLLCHAPAHTKAVLQVPDKDEPAVNRKASSHEARAVRDEIRKEDADRLLAPAPLPNRSFDQGANGYGHDREMDHILVRVDVTYLRQDFSALLPVENAAPWPDFQRFDFLVRTRSLSETEAAALRQRLQPQREGELSPHQQAILFGLRELTGLEATTAADWRRVLKLPGAP